MILLPTAAAKQLRNDESVAFLQRIWMGEGREEWETSDSSSTNRGLQQQSDECDARGVTWTTGTYLYDGSGNIKQIGSETYAYDWAGRLVQAVVDGTTETYKYDSFGNLIEKTISGKPAGTIAVEPSSNRLKGETYDAAGNVTSSGGRTVYKYDALNLMTEATSSLGLSKRLVYSADDERVGVQMEPYSAQWRFRDITGTKVIREFKQDSGGVFQWVSDYVYADDTLVAGQREAYFGGKLAYHLDHPGTVRLTNDQRAKVCLHKFSPFGIEKTESIQEVTNYSYTRPETMKYTGHERDYNGTLSV